MPVDVILGLQWGDEGKGKIVDKLSDSADVVVRFQGGANAGHTVYYNGNEIKLHLIPSGIIHRDTICLIGNGVVFDPEIFAEEVSVLNGYGIKCPGKLFISKRAHLVFPFHKFYDAYFEEYRGKESVGTTRRGVGPAYADKFGRIGIRVGDLYDDEVFIDRLRALIDYYNGIFVNVFGKEPVDFKSMRNHFVNYKNMLKRYVKDTEEMLYDFQKEGKNIIMEGAQAALLDIDYGTYPFVTSSNTTLGAVFTGAGISPFEIRKILGVTKAYTTRVGKGPFPTEFSDKQFEKDFRDKAGEYGASTGRPRQCGWLDLVALKYAVKRNHINNLIVTKLDILSGLSSLKICTAYDYNGSISQEFPPESYVLDKVKPVYTEMERWEEDISKIRKYEELPGAARKYIDFIENYIGVKAYILSVGKKREDIIYRSV